MPVVWLGERAREPQADVVRTDDDTGLKLLVDHRAWPRGPRHHLRRWLLGFTAGPDRAVTYRAAMTYCGLAGCIFIVLGGFGEEDGADAARLLLARDRLPTAVIGCSYESGAGLLATFARAGISVPGTISVTGYDDSDIAALSYNDLTAVRQDIDLTVDATLAAITRPLANPTTTPREVPTEASLTVRSSTGPPRPR